MRKTAQGIWIWRIFHKQPGFPRGNIPFRYTEAKGIFSFEKRISPRPPEEKRGGISISPRTPLKRHKGAGCGPPLWKPLPGTEPASAERSGTCGSRNTPIRFCSPACAMPAGAGTQFFEEYLSAQPAGDFQILSEARDGQPLVLDELTGKAVNSSLTFFLFHRARRIFFLMSQKENGGCILCGPQSLREQRNY